MIIKTYQVARHLFRLELPVDKPTGEKILKAYAPFETQTEEPPLFTLHLHLCQELPVPPQEQLLKHFDQELPFLWVFQSNIGYTFGFSLTPGKPEALVCDTVQPTEKTLYLCETSTPEQLTFGLHNALMLTFTRQTAPLDTLLIHSSVICKDQQGYAFLGKSGTGKSTHSRLWLQYIPGSELLNDDNPVIRICHGTPVIFGSPWSGKTPCYKNKEVPLKAIVRLSRAPVNHITRLTGSKAYASLLPSCSSVKWDSSITDCIHHTLEQVVTHCKFYHLQCRPDQEAAVLCAQTLQTS